MDIQLHIPKYRISEHNLDRIKLVHNRLREENKDKFQVYADILRLVIDDIQQVQDFSKAIKGEA